MGISVSEKFFLNNTFAPPRLCKRTPDDDDAIVYSVTQSSSPSSGNVEGSWSPINYHHREDGDDDEKGLNQ